MQPDLEFGADIPPEARSSIQSWYKDQPFEPPKIRIGRVLYALSHPYGGTVLPATVERIGTVEIWVRHGERVRFFLLRDGQWSLGHATDDFPFQRDKN